MLPPIDVRSIDQPACAEAELLSRMVQALNKRIDDVVVALPQQIEDAVTRAVSAHTLSPEQRQWVALAIQREAQSIKLRQAIIEKTLAGLVWAGVVGIGLMAWDWLAAHGLQRKP